MSLRKTIAIIVLIVVVGLAAFIGAIYYSATNVKIDFDKRYDRILLSLGGQSITYTVSIPATNNGLFPLDVSIDVLVENDRGETIVRNFTSLSIPAGGRATNISLTFFFDKQAVLKLTRKVVVKGSAIGGYFGLLKQSFPFDQILDLGFDPSVVSKVIEKPPVFTLSPKITEEQKKLAVDKPPASMGTLVVRSTPVKGEILIDGKSVSKEGVYTANYEAGRELEVSFGTVLGYRRPEPVKVVMKADSITSVTGSYALVFSREKASSEAASYSPPPPKQGRLSITTTPVKGEIFINGNSVSKQGDFTRLYDPDVKLTISYGEVSGYETPKPVGVTIQEGRTLVVTGTYLEKISEVQIAPTLAVKIESDITVLVEGRDITFTIPFQTNASKAGPGEVNVKIFNSAGDLIAEGNNRQNVPQGVAKSEMKVKVFSKYADSLYKKDILRIVLTVNWEGKTYESTYSYEWAV